MNKEALFAQLNGYRHHSDPRHHYDRQAKPWIRLAAWMVNPTSSFLRSFSRVESQWQNSNIMASQFDRTLLSRRLPIPKLDVRFLESPGRDLRRRSSPSKNIPSPTRDNLSSKGGPSIPHIPKQLKRNVGRACTASPTDSKYKNLKAEDGRGQDLQDFRTSITCEVRSSWPILSHLSILYARSSRGRKHVGR